MTWETMLDTLNSTLGTYWGTRMAASSNRDQRRTTIICGVACCKTVDNARNNMKEVEIFAQSPVDCEGARRTGSRPIDFRATRDLVVAAVKGASDKAGMEIPFPYRKLTLKETFPLHTQHKAA